MADNILLSQYLMESVVKRRNSVGLIEWAGSVTAQSIPTTKPDTAWVQQRLVAERIPQQPDGYTQRTLAYFLQDPTTQTNIREYLNSFNDDATEVALGAQINSVITAFMPRFAASDVTDQQVQQWYDSNGFGTPLSRGTTTP